ncbi:MAG: hypothetical protein AB7U48_12370 [Bauldia sp.]
MAIDLKSIVTHDSTESCVACRAQDVAIQVLAPAVEAWETSNGLPRFALALHGAAELLGKMLQQGVSRDDVESALSLLLDDIERQLAEDAAMGGPPQGSA